MAKNNTGFGRKFSKSKLISAIAFDAFFVGLIAIAFSVNPLTHAANYSITGGSYGPLCNSGGYFTPNKTAVVSGSTVTISVPANDPYSGGLEVHGFPEGDFTVQNGTSHTTQPLKANVSFYGSWPFTGCTKGSGTITVTHATPPPPPPPPPPVPTPSPTPHPTPAPHPSPTPPPGAPAHKTTPQPKPHPGNPTPQPIPSPTTKNQEPIEYDNPAGGSGAKSISASDTSTKLSPQRKAIGYTSVLLAAGITCWIIWQLCFRPTKY